MVISQLHDEINSSLTPTAFPSMRDLPPLNALRAFEAAARLGSFQAASEELHVTPTAISHQIRNLEEIIDVQLFHRKPRPIRLTSAGRRLFPAIREALDRIANGVSSVRPDANSSPLIMTTTRAFASRWLIPRMGRMHQDRDLPPFAVDASERVLNLHSGHVDFAIRYMHLPPMEFESKLLFTDRYIAVCSASLMQGASSPDAIGDLPLIHFDWKNADNYTPTWSRWIAGARKAFPNVGLPDPESGVRFSEEIHAIDAAILGQGIALLSDHMVQAEIENGRLIQPIDFSIEGLSFYAVYDDRHLRKAEIEQTVDAIMG